MAETIWKTGRTYATPYEMAYNKLKANSPFFNDDDWRTWNAKNELGTYVQVQTDASKLDPVKMEETYKFNVLDSDTKMSALMNELYADKENKAERFEISYDEKGKEIKTSIGEMSDYDYTKYLIDRQAKIEEEKLARLAEQERKDNMSWFEKLGASVVAGLGELAEGVTTFIDDIVQLFTAVGVGLAHQVAGNMEKATSDIMGEEAGKVISDYNKDVFGEKRTFEAGFRKTYERDYGRIFELAGFEDDLAEFESKYTWFRDIDGNYTTVGKYIGGTLNSIGYMLPTVALTMATSGGSTAATFGFKTARAASQVTFYTGMASGNINEMVDTLPSSVPTWQIVTNAASKAVVEWGVERLLGKAFGGTMLDNILYGTGVKTVTGKTLGKQFVKGLAIDAFQEGLEESLQELSGWFVDAAFHELNSNFGNYEWDLQTILDAFVMGALSSIVMTEGKVLTTRKVNTGTSKIGKHASYAYNMNYTHFMETYSELVNEKTSDAEKLKLFKTMYGTSKALVDIYKNIGEERFKAATEMLKAVEDSAKDGKYDREVIETKAKELAKLVNNLGTDSVKKLETDLNNAKITAAEKFEDDKAISSAANLTDATKSKVNKSLERLKSYSKKDIFVSEDGSDIVITDNAIFVPINYAKSANGEILYENVVEKEVISTIVKNKDFSGILTDIKNIYVQYTNDENVTTEEVLYNLLFNNTFYRLCLMQADKSLFKFLSKLKSIVKVSVSKDLDKDARTVFTKKFSKIWNNCITELLMYCSQQSEISIDEIESYEILSNEQLLAVKNQRYNFILGQKVVAGDKLSDNEKTILESRVNYTKLTVEQKKSLLSKLYSTSENARRQGLTELDAYYNGMYLGKYNGTIRLTTDFFGNCIFNNLLDNYGAENTDILSTIKRNDALMTEIQNSGLTVEEYVSKTFYDLSKGKYTLSFEDGKPIITATSYNDVASVTEYQSVRAELYSTENVDKRKLITVNKTNTSKILDDLTSDAVSASTKLMLTVDDLLRNPKYLKKEYRDKMSGMSFEERFNFLRRELINTYGTISLSIKTDGTVVITNVTPMVNSVSKPITKKSLKEDGRLSNYIKTEFLTERGKSCTIEFSKTGDGSNAYYNAATNTIIIDENVSDDSLTYIVLHEFQHIVQVDTGLNLGFDNNWLKQLATEQQNAILNDVNTHFPKLLENAKTRDEQIETVSNFIYESSGETAATGYEDLVVDFYPVIVGNNTIRMPWGSKFSYNGYKQSMTDNPVYKKSGLFFRGYLTESLKETSNKALSLQFAIVDRLSDALNPLANKFAKIVHKSKNPKYIEGDKEGVFVLTANYDNYKLAFLIDARNDSHVRFILKDLTKKQIIINSSTKLSRLDKNTGWFSDTTKDFIPAKTISKFLLSCKESLYTASQLEQAYEMLYNVEPSFMSKLLRDDKVYDLNDSKLLEFVKNIQNTSEYYHNLTRELKSKYQSKYGTKVSRDETYEFYPEYKEKSLRDMYELYYKDSGISYEDYLDIDIPFVRYVYDKSTIDLDITKGEHASASVFLGLHGPTALPKMFVGFDDSDSSAYSGTVKPKELDIAFIWGFSEFGKSELDPRGKYNGYLGVEGKVPNYVLKRNNTSKTYSLLQNSGIFNIEDVLPEVLNDYKQGLQKSASDKSTPEQKAIAREKLRKIEQQRLEKSESEYSKKKKIRIDRLNTVKESRSKAPSLYRTYVSADTLSSELKSGGTLNDTALRYYKGRYVRKDLLKFLASIPVDKLNKLPSSAGDYDLANMIKKGTLTYEYLNYWFGKYYEDCNDFLYKRVMTFLYKNKYLAEKSVSDFVKIVKDDIPEQYKLYETIKLLSDGYYMSPVTDGGKVTYKAVKFASEEEYSFFKIALDSIMDSGLSSVETSLKQFQDNAYFSNTQLFYNERLHGAIDSIESPLVKSVAKYYDGSNFAGSDLMRSAIVIGENYEGVRGVKWKSPTVEYSSQSLDENMVSKDGVSRSVEEMVGDKNLDPAEIFANLSSEDLDEILRKIALKRTSDAADKEYDSSKPAAASRYYSNILAKLEESVYDTDYDMAKKNESLLRNEYAKIEFQEIYGVDYKPAENTKRLRKYKITSIRKYADRISGRLKGLRRNKKVRDALISALGRHANIVDKNYDVNRTAYQHQSESLIDDMLYTLQKVSNDIKNGKYDDSTSLAMYRQIEKLKKRLAETKAPVNKSEQKVIKVQDEKLTVTYDTDVPYVVEQVMSKGYLETAPSKVQVVSKADARHWTMSVNSFLETNAELLNVITEQDAEDIVKFYEQSSVLFMEKDARTERLYLYNKLCLLGTILMKSNEGTLSLDASLIERIDKLLENTVSIPAGVLPIYRTVLKKIRPQEVILKSIGKINGIDFSEKPDLIENVCTSITSLKNAKNDADLKRAVESLKIHREQLYNFAREKSDLMKDDFLTKVFNFERMAMLSSPATWIRNISSNITVSITSKLSEKIGKLFVGKKRKIQGQYDIAGTKASLESVNFINSLSDSGLFKLIRGGASKYDTRKQTNIKNHDKNDVGELANIIAHSVAEQVYDENLWRSSPKSKIGKASKSMIDWCHKQTMKLLSDETFIERAAKTYMAKMLTEDKVDLTNGLSEQVVTIIVNAYTLATIEYMHKPNIFNKIEQVIKQKSTTLWFVYKQILPFASASWNWFAEGINYTPIGLAKSIINFMKLEKNIDKIELAKQKGEKVADPRFTRYILTKQIGKGVIGTVGFILGAILAATGIANIDEEDDKIKLFVGDVKIDITGIFGTQGISLGMSFASARHGNAEQVVTDFFDTMLNDSLFGDIINSLRYTDTVGEYLLQAPANVLSSLYPNFIKFISNAINRRELSYSPGIAGNFERLWVQMIPGIAYTMPAKYDPYTGELQMKYNLPWYYDILNRISPVKIYKYSYSNTEDVALSLGVHKSSLTGKYDDIGQLSKSDVAKLNEYYGQRNKEDLDNFINNKVKYKVMNEKTGKYENITYSKMTDKQKKSVIERIMSNNAKVAKIYVYTENGGKYYADSSEYKELKFAGLKNIFKENKKQKGFK